MPMRNMSKTDSGCGASCAATSPETIAAGVGRDGSYVVTDVPRATGRRSMGTIVQQPPWGLPVVGGARQIPGRWPARSPAAARPARPRAVRAASFARSGRSRGPPWPCRRPRAPQPHRRPCGGLRACLSFACCRPGSAAHARSSFARNSREDVSGFEIGSLIFCGFRAVDERGPGGITCDFDKGTAGCGRLVPATSGVAVSHAIPPEYLACSYHFVYLSHSCSGIACNFGEGWCWRVGGMWHGRVVRERDAGERRGGVGREMGWRGVPQFRMQFPLSTLLVRIASYI